MCKEKRLAIYSNRVLNYEMVQKLFGDMRNLPFVRKSLEVCADSIDYDKGLFDLTDISRVAVVTDAACSLLTGEKSHEEPLSEKVLTSLRRTGIPTLIFKSLSEELPEISNSQVTVVEITENGVVEIPENGPRPGSGESDGR